MTFYAQTAAEAHELLREYGVAVTLGVTTSGAYNPATGAVSVTTANAATYGYVEDYADRDIDGTNIVVGDRRVYLSTLTDAGSSVPKPGTDDSLTFDGVAHRIIQSKAIPGAGTAALYDVQVRR